VRRIIQISAISADEAANTPYALSKKRADGYLASSGDALDWIILRPSLVYAAGAYGGTALFRGLAAMPFFIPVVGKGEQAFQPIHIDDLAATILKILATPSMRAQIIDPVGPDRLMLRDILADLRRWLGLPPAPVIHIPLWIIRPLARLGDVFGATISTTALRQMDYGNVGDLTQFVAATGIKPRRWVDALLADPAQVQDRWHARLYFVRPILRLALALTWIVSGIVGLAGLGGGAAANALVGSDIAMAACIVDIMIGVLVVLRWRPGALALVQLALVGAYTLFLTLAAPGLWLNPFGPLLKNLVFATGVLALAAMETER
jgi:hypothetical protein